MICYVIYFKIKAFKVAYSKKQDDESSVGGALCNVQIMFNKDFSRSMKKSFAASSAFCLNADSKTLLRIRRDGGALALISVQPWTNSKWLIDHSECALIFVML